MEPEMKKLFYAIAALTLTACGSAWYIKTDYKGPDAGRVILGFGATAETSYSTYKLIFRRTDDGVQKNEAISGAFIFCQTNVICGGKFDYKNSTESGVVINASISPGKYEIFRFNVYYNDGFSERNFSSEKEFSIPFEVKPGATTYLGNYQAKGLTTKNMLGIDIPAGAAFIVEDRGESDIALARNKDGAIPLNVESTVPDIKSLAKPMFITPR